MYELLEYKTFSVIYFPDVKKKKNSPSFPFMNLSQAFYNDY